MLVVAWSPPRLNKITCLAQITLSITSSNTRLSHAHLDKSVVSTRVFRFVLEFGGGFDGRTSSCMS